MHATRMLLTATALLVANAAMAHSGLPGHIHPEMTTAQQAMHAAMNWAPVIVLVLCATLSLRKALRPRA